MSGRVLLEAAGSHAFDLGHLKREGGERLVELLLERAGLHQDVVWRLQVQKKLLCNGETAPVRVVDEAKKWAVHLKIKPGDNNTAHYCSLLMPEGMHGETVYQSLKAVEATLDRNWKNSTRVRVRSERPALAVASVSGPPEKEAVAAMLDTRPEMAGGEEDVGQGDAALVPAAAGAAAEPTGRQPEPGPKARSPIKGWVNDPERVKLLLLAVHEVDGMRGQVHDNGHFAELFCQRLGCKDLNRHETGGIFAGLARKGYVTRVLRGSRPTGYELSLKGWLLVEDVLKQDPGAAPPPAAAVAPPPDPAQLILAFGQLARQFVEATARLERLAAREAEITSELETLRRERQEICKLLDDQEVQSMVGRLARVRKP